MGKVTQLFLYVMQNDYIVWFPKNIDINAFSLYGIGFGDKTG